MGDQETCVDLLVNTSRACNLMPSSLCKKLGLDVKGEAHTLVGFSGESNKTIGTTKVRTRLGDCWQSLTFHVTLGKVQPILGYPGLKDMHLMVDCEGDCLTRKDVKRLLCHPVKVKEGDRLIADNSPVVRITITREVQGSKVMQKENRLLIHASVPVVLGPRETRIIITEEIRWKDMVPKLGSMYVRN